MLQPLCQVPQNGLKDSTILKIFYLNGGVEPHLGLESDWLAFLLGCSDRDVLARLRCEV